MGQAGLNGAGRAVGSNFQNPSKKMLLYESFRMVRVSRHLKACIKVMAKILSTYHVTKKNNFEIWGAPLHPNFYDAIHPPAPLASYLKYRPDMWEIRERRIWIKKRRGMLIKKYHGHAHGHGCVSV